MGAALGPVGLGAQAAGMVLQMKAQADATAAKVQADQQSAQLAHLHAADALARGALAGGRARMQAGQVIGAQRAALGASGVDANSGTAVTDAADTAGMAELDALTIQNNAAREAWGYDVSATAAENQGALDRQNGPRQAFSTFLGGAQPFISAGMRA